MSETEQTIVSEIDRIDAVLANTVLPVAPKTREFLAEDRAALEKLLTEARKPKPRPTREELIELCERAIVNVERWGNRDTPHTQVRIGQAWALLKAGCDFDFTGDPKQGEHGSWWIDITRPSFNSFEYDRTDPEYWDTDMFYIPTAERLDAHVGQDWY